MLGKNAKNTRPIAEASNDGDFDDSHEQLSYKGVDIEEFAAESFDAKSV